MKYRITWLTRMVVQYRRVVWKAKGDKFANGALFALKLNNLSSGMKIPSSFLAKIN
ncbi:hypothetical protein M513_01323, partial [Trichuris suis]